MFLSVFDIFKICIGPSSSHTMGPMVAAARFLDEILNGDWPRPADATPDHLTVSLHGSLAYTGIGHASDRAIILGLAGELPDRVDPDQMDAIVENVKSTRRINPAGHDGYRFNPETDLLLDRKTPLPGHANGMQFCAYDNMQRLLLKRHYFSIGGGFVVDEKELEDLKNGAVSKEETNVPFPFTNAGEMLSLTEKSGLSIAAMKRLNEESHDSAEVFDRKLDEIWKAMDGCINRGISQDGIM
ncbi:MAG: serine dehydratase beta chain, partial [Rhizobiaceae bacterium]